MPAQSCGRACVRFVDDDELGASLQKVISSLATLDVVEADHRMRMNREDAYPGRDAPLQSASALGRHGRSTDVEANFQFGHPLIDKVRRTENHSALDVTAIE